jgi:hypothetical protein
MSLFKRCTGWVLAIVGSFGLVSAAGKPVADVPILVSFGHTESDALTSDGFIAPGFADDYADGVENVLAVIQGSGNLRFGTQSDESRAALRHLCVNFGDQFAAGGMLVPFLDGNPRQCVNVLQPMHAYLTGDVSINALRYGQSVEKLTRFAWDDSGYRYRIGYGTDMDMNGALDSPSVRVTCIAATSSTAPCSKWVLAPSTDGTAALFRFKLTNKKGAVQEGSPEFVAQVVMPFVETLSRK